ncbi:hypothetical protein LCGC14_2087530 [marine sediment metagenome]|uniref:Uncharacterized protein n=1 Tax=marine sediment metagenome TaxID=412755 RepID=A0A0F9F140_9ZZZZ
MLIKIGGKERELKLTVGTLRRFEKRSGVKLFSALSGELGKVLSAPGKQMSEADGIKLFAGVFPGVTEVAALLYECCVTLKEQRSLTFDDFCDDIDVSMMGTVVRTVLEEIGEFMPEAPEAQDSASGDASVPLGQ